MHSGNSFIAKSDHVGSSDVELSYRKGDAITILSRENGWCYGIIQLTSRQGWFPEDCLHESSFSDVVTNGYTELDETVCNDSVKTVISAAIEQESQYLSSLEAFLTNVIWPAGTKDSVFKKHFLDNPTVILCFEQWTIIKDSTAIFIQDLKLANKKSDINFLCKAFMKFASSLNNIALYATECCNLLNLFKIHSDIIHKTLDSNLKDLDSPIEDYVVFPIQNYMNYQNYLNEILQIKSLSFSEKKSTQQTFDIIIEYSDKIDLIIQNEQNRFDLIALQYQFIGSPMIYKPERKLILQGIIHLLINGTERIHSKEFYGHLFNDALICSELLQNNNENGNNEYQYKFCSIIEFNEMKVTITKSPSSTSASTSNAPCTFTIKGGPYDDIFYCESEYDRDKWVSAIEEQLQACRKRRGGGFNMSAVVSQLEGFLIAHNTCETLLGARRRSSGSGSGSSSTTTTDLSKSVNDNSNKHTNSKQTLSMTSSSDTTTSTTTSRSYMHGNITSPPTSTPIPTAITAATAVSARVMVCRDILKTLKLQVFNLDVLTRVLVLPLQDACNGSVLTAGKVRHHLHHQCDTTDTSGTGSGSGSGCGSVDEDELSSVSDSSESQSQSQQQSQYERGRVVSSQRSSTLTGKAMSTISMRAVHFAAMDECLHTPAVQTFMMSILGMLAGVQGICMAVRGRLHDIDTAAKERYFMNDVNVTVAPISISYYIDRATSGMKRILTLLESFKLLINEEDEDPEYENISQGIIDLQNIILFMNEQICINRNNEKMHSIRDVIVSNDPLVEQILYTNRIFIRESDLIKICRKGKKKYHFWLFNDYLLYGSSTNKSLPLGGFTPSYQINRIINLQSCDIQTTSTAHTATTTTTSFSSFASSSKSSSNSSSSVSNDTKKDVMSNAFDILSSEKSFTVIAENEEMAQDWIFDLRMTIAALKADANTGSSSLSSSSSTIAPVWTSDKDGGQCNVCQQSFSFFKRRHHCRKCGSLVCSTHSKQSVVLSNIHPSDKQRVCDDCYGAIVTELHSHTSHRAKPLHPPPPPPPSRLSTAATSTSNMVHESRAGAGGPMKEDGGGGSHRGGVGHNRSVTFAGEGFAERKVPHDHNDYDNDGDGHVSSSNDKRRRRPVSEGFKRDVTTSDPLNICGSGIASGGGGSQRIPPRTPPPAPPQKQHSMTAAFDAFSGNRRSETIHPPPTQPTPAPPSRPNNKVPSMPTGVVPTKKERPPPPPPPPRPFVPPTTPPPHHQHHASSVSSNPSDSISTSNNNNYYHSDDITMDPVYQKKLSLMKDIVEGGSSSLRPVHTNDMSSSLSSLSSSYGHEKVVSNIGDNTGGSVLNILSNVMNDRRKAFGPVKMVLDESDSDSSNFSDSD
eukprot:gene3024-5928_t